MVMQFELFWLAGKGHPVDEVVGWGIFPLVDGAFSVIKGKFRLPLLRGPVDTGLKTFS